MPAAQAGDTDGLPELLKMATTDADRRDFIATIESSAARGAAMVRQVLSFARGVEGRRLPVQLSHLIRDVEIAVIVTDMMMPNMDGRGLVGALRTLAPAVPVIGASGLDLDEEHERSVGPGAEHFPAKPYTIEALLRLLERVPGPA